MSIPAGDKCAHTHTHTPCPHCSIYSQGRHVRSPNLVSFIHNKWKVKMKVKTTFLQFSRFLFCVFDQLVIALPDLYNTSEESRINTWIHRPCVFRPATRIFTLPSPNRDESFVSSMNTTDGALVSKKWVENMWSTYTLFFSQNSGYVAILLNFIMHFPPVMPTNAIDGGRSMSPILCPKMLSR